VTTRRASSRNKSRAGITQAAASRKISGAASRRSTRVMVAGVMAQIFVTIICCTSCRSWAASRRAAAPPQPEREHGHGQHAEDEELPAVEVLERRD